MAIVSIPVSKFRVGVNVAFLITNQSGCTINPEII
jgi:hypothetical protein